jgi:hypothetical protein
MHHRALEEGAPESLAARLRDHRQAELGALVAKTDVQHREGLEVIVLHREEAVVLEIDARHVGAHAIVADRRTEAQPPVLAVEREEMGFERLPVGFAQAHGGGDVHFHLVRLLVGDAGDHVGAVAPLIE